MIWRAHKNNEVMEPESRIYAVFVAGPILAAGLFLYGASAAASLHWTVPITGMGLVGAGIPISGEAVLAYVTECYSHKAGEASTAMIPFETSSLVPCSLPRSLGSDTTACVIPSSPWAKLGSGAGPEISSALSIVVPWALPLGMSQSEMIRMNRGQVWRRGWLKRLRGTGQS